MKILSPAGNLECLKSAVFNGADEVYLGIDDFNARNIQGFTIDTLLEAVDFAHIFGVRVFLAINILFNDEEFFTAVKTVIDAYNIGIDAFIIQDLGLASYLSKNYPNIELHASTQMGGHNLEGVKELERIGFKRVVLARETPLEEVKRIRDNSDIEIEYFVHGALCVSFSGNCYLSSYLHNASGNRGKCKQLCRLPYTLKFKDKTVKKGYLLSAKDFSMINRLKELQDAGVTSLKIEGRARRQFYVATATRSYRNALDGKPFNYSDLVLAFNRGSTEGYFSGNGNIISNVQNHIGLEIGKVEKVNIGKKFNQVYITSNIELNKKSTFKFTNNGIEKNVLTAYDLKKINKGYYLITTTQKVDKGLTVHLIADADKETEVANFTLKRKANIKVLANVNQPIKASCTEMDLEVSGEVCLPATSSPLTKDEIVECFNKSEYFSSNVEVIIDGDCFMPKSKLNAFRREFFNELYQKIVSAYRKNQELKNIDFPPLPKPFTDFEIVNNLEVEFKAKNIVYSPSEYKLDDILSFKERCLKLNKNAYLDLPNFALKQDILMLKDVIEKSQIGIVANNYYALYLSDNVVMGSGLNVYNSLTARYLDKPFMVAEGSLIKPTFFPYMTFRHCPIKAHVGGDCKNCLYKDGYTYHTQDGKVFTLKRKKLFTCTFYLE